MSTAYLGTVLADSPLAYWRLGEPSGLVAYDASGHGNHATINASGVTLAQSGAILQDNSTSFKFDGVAGKITAPAGVSPNGWGSISVEFWLKLSTVSLPTSPAVFANDITGGSAKGIAIYLNSTATAINFVLGNGSSATTCSGGFTFAINTWYHIVATLSSTAMVVYVNGVSKGTATFTGTIASTTAGNLTIAHNPGGTDFLTGTADEVALYAYGLTAGQVTAHYNAGIALSTAMSAIPNNSKTRVVQAEDVNQLVYVLQQQSGGQEVGHYFLEQPCYVAGATASWYIAHLSHTSVPVSVTLDASDLAQVGFTTTVPSTGTLKPDGFQIFAFAVTGPQPNPRVGGLYTTQF